MIKRIGNLITFIDGDYHLAQKWYGAKGKYQKSFNYPSNLYKDHQITDKLEKTIYIQIGNSADSSNNHLEILENLVKFKDKDIKIIAPPQYRTFFILSFRPTGERFFLSSG